MVHSRRVPSPLAFPLGLLLAAAAFAQDNPDPWTRAPFEADPQDLLTAAKAVPSEPGTSAVILLTETRWTYQADGRAECRYRTVYRILTQEGVGESSTVSADWSPWYQNRPTIRARVVTPDGKAHALNPDTLSEKSLSAGNPDVFTDRRSLTGPLPAVVPGALIEMETVTPQSKPFYDRGVVEYQNFGGGLPVRRQRLVLDAPEGLVLRYRIRLMPDLKPTVQSADGRTVITFEAGPLAPREAAEPFAPSDVPSSTHVVFGWGGSWNDVARRYHEIVEAQIADADVKGLGELPGKDLSAKERIERILGLMNARVRYTSLAFGEASIVPRPPGETLKRGYGDCKDKAALLVAVLRKLGMEAHVAVLSTGPGPDVEAELPGFGAFDHAIVRVDSDPPLWVDPTDPYSPPGVLPIQDQDRLALVAAPGTDGLVHTPASAPADNRDFKIREFRLAEFGPATLVETRRPSGSLERYLRGMLDQDKKAVDKNMEQYAKSVFMAEKVTGSRFTDPKDLSKPLEIVLEMSGVGRGQTDLREAVVGVQLANLLADLPWFLRNEESEEAADKPARKHDVVFPQPYVMEWEYHIIPPPGFRPRTFPNSEKVDLGPAVLKKEFKTNEDGSVSALFRFDCGRRRLTAAEAAGLRKGALRLIQEGVLLIGFVQVGTEHLEAGRIREALTEYRKLSEAAPDKALYHAQIARAFLAGGLGDAARREARRAVEMEPGSMIAHQTLGWILQHDLIGRRFAPGWDPKGAAEAYRATLKSTANKLENTLDLAILLEHDASGQRYSPEAHLREAIDLYKSVVKEIDGTNFENNLNYALLWAGDFDGLRARLKKPGTSTAQMMLVVAKAALEGADSAMLYAMRSIPADETRQGVLAQAGEHLVKLRYYPQAAALLAAAARGAQDAANLLGRADRLAKTKRWDTAPPEVDEPGEVVKRFMYLLMTPEPDFPGMQKLMSKYCLLESDQTWENTFRQMRTGVLQIFMKQGIPSRVGVDVTLSLIEPAVEGERAHGFRVRVPAAFGNGGMQLWYLVVEDGTLRLIVPASGTLGRLALDLLEAGRVEDARKWLAWASDEKGDDSDRETPEGNPFAILWKKRKDGDAAALRLAAAALAVEGQGCAAAVPVLEEARKAPDLDRKALYLLDHALYYAFMNLGRKEDGTAAARRMLESEPDAEITSFFVEQALRKEQKWDDLIAHCQDQLKRKPNNADILHTLQQTEMRLGHFPASLDYGKRIVKAGKADAHTYNSLAWTALLEGKALRGALQDAQKSVQQSQGRLDYCLHTLATVYADLGRPVEARNVLLQTFRARVDAEPQDVDWYVLGRIAEEYGATESAIEAYRKTATAPDATQPQSTNQLSLRRLKILEKQQ